LQLFSWEASIEAAPIVGSVMSQLLGWTADETSDHVDDYVQKINRLMDGIGLKRHDPVQRMAGFGEIPK
jgi:hypothetical protein